MHGKVYLSKEEKQRELPSKQQEGNAGGGTNTGQSFDKDVFTKTPLKYLMHKHRNRSQRDIRVTYWDSWGFMIDEFIEGA